VGLSPQAWIGPDCLAVRAVHLPQRAEFGYHAED